jgi:hypothetical protein
MGTAPADRLTSFLPHAFVTCQQKLEKQPHAQ